MAVAGEELGHRSILQISESLLTKFVRRLVPIRHTRRRIVIVDANLRRMSCERRHHSLGGHAQPTPKSGRPARNRRFESRMGSVTEPLGRAVVIVDSTEESCACGTMTIPRRRRIEIR